MVLALPRHDVCFVWGGLNLHTLRPLLDWHAEVLSHFVSYFSTHDIVRCAVVDADVTLVQTARDTLFKRTLQGTHSELSMTGGGTCRISMANHETAPDRRIETVTANCLET